MSLAAATLAPPRTDVPRHKAYMQLRSRDSAARACVDWDANEALSSLARCISVFRRRDSLESV